ncbi:Arc family DNA-binding protein [Chitiniphilus shinanonensis]|uniref:Arc family DNA-binding protein n=1 Tax=Chitiniphilus shinanonensis TaxID=553088 RepID=UPI00302ED853
MKGSGNLTPLGVRMPDKLRAYLKERAKKHRRSLNSEIVLLLEEVRSRDVTEVYEEEV